MEIETSPDRGTVTEAQSGMVLAYLKGDLTESERDAFEEEPVLMALVDVGHDLRLARELVV